MPACPPSKPRTSAGDRGGSPVLMTSTAPESWTLSAYCQAVDESSLHQNAKRTLIAMTETARGQRTTIDRASLCALTGVRREATITRHWRQARAAGLLLSKHRYNRSSIHTFTLPGVPLPAADGVHCQPLRVHIWTSEQIAWWNSLDDGIRSPPPWGNGSPPF